MKKANSPFCLNREIGHNDLTGMREIRGKGGGIFKNEKLAKRVN